MIDLQDPAANMLLTCLANPEGDHAEQFASLSAADCNRILQLAQRSRCIPLLHHVVSRSGVELSIAHQMAQASRDQALTSLAQARGLAHAICLLREAGLEPVALKGVALAWRDYPAPHMRILRDVDLLVPAESAETAHQLLLSQDGYRLAPWAGQYGIEYGHQLPEIVDETHGLVIEIHHRLNARGWAGDGRLTQIVRQETEVLDLLGEAIRVPSSRANLLHLVEHATLHHAFATGPSILADLHYLTRSRSFDWASLVDLARELDLMRPLELLALLAHRLGARWVPEVLLRSAEIKEEMLTGAALAMFAEEEAHSQYMQLWRLASHGGGETGLRQAMVRMFRPNRYQLARLSGRSPQSLWRWLGYPPWLLEKGVRFRRARRVASDSRGYSSYAALRQWIEADAHGANDDSE